MTFTQKLCFQDECSRCIQKICEQFSHVILTMLLDFHAFAAHPLSVFILDPIGLELMLSDIKL